MKVNKDINNVGVNKIKSSFVEKMLEQWKKEDRKIAIKYQRYHNPAKSTLQDSEELISSVRRSGNTTRLVDKAIQDLFSGCIIKAEDHYEREVGDRDLYFKILKRLKHEHNLLDKDLDLNFASKTIGIKLNVLLR